MEPLSDSTPCPLIRVFLLIENRLLRQALPRLFRKRPDLLVVGQSGLSEAAPCQVLDARCDVLITDSFQTSWLPVSTAHEKAGQ
jgi:hypothetical protein